MDGLYTGSVRKYADDGAELWARNLTTTGNASVFDVTVDVTGVYVAGWTDGDLQGQGSSGVRSSFVRKYSIDGDALWTRQFVASGSAGDSARALTAYAGAIYVVGATSGTFAGQTSSGYSDAFVRKYTPDGDEVWTRQFGTSGGDAARAIVADATGVYVAGSGGEAGNEAILQKLTLDGEVSWWRQFVYNVVTIAWGVATDDSGVYVAGSAEWMVVEGGSGFLRKYTTDGDEIWSREDYNPDWFRGVATGPRGVFTSGTQGGEGGDFAREYDADGKSIWSLFLDTPGESGYWGDIDVQPTGIYLTGIRWGAFPSQPSAGGIDAYVAKIVVPRGSVVPGSVDFGEVEFGGSVTTDVTIQSTGTAPLTVASISAAFCQAGFSIRSPRVLPVVVPVGTYVNVTIAFSPTSVGLAQDVLRIATDDPGGILPRYS